MLNLKNNSAAIALLTAIAMYVASSTYTIAQTTIPEQEVQPAPVIELKKEPKVDRREVYCLAEAIYFESNDESIKGQEAVGHVIINRTKHKDFPGTVCKVVNQKYKKYCQFSYKCDGKSDVPSDKKEFSHTIKISEKIMSGTRDNTFGAVYFHNKTVRPNWANKFRLTTVIGNHKFYKA